MKICKKCNFPKEDTEFGFYKDAHGKKVIYYQKGHCRECERKWAKKNRIRLNALKPPKEIIPEPTSKICTCCRLEKEMIFFGKFNDNRLKNGTKVRYTSNCLECLGKKFKAYHESVKDNPDFKSKNQKRAHDWYLKNTDFANERNRERSVVSQFES